MKKKISLVLSNALGCVWITIFVIGSITLLAWIIKTFLSVIGVI